MMLRDADPQTQFEGGEPPTGSLDSAPEGDAVQAQAPDDQRRRYAAVAAGELGRGGMGQVAARHDRWLDRTVASKQLLTELRDRSGAEARFLREARAAARLEHPNIVPIYDIGRGADGQLYYTMKRVQGRTLASLLREASGLPERLASLDAFVATCQAMAYAHTRGVIHRDLKPQNIMVGAFGETLVLDWGLARETDSAAEILTGPARGAPVQTLGAAGTPAWMSPEQAEAQPVTPRSDVWALGAMLYQILTGTLPFGQGGWVRGAMLRPVRSLVLEAPADLAAVAERALAVDPTSRYADAGELMREVQAWQAGLRVSAHRYSPQELARRWVARHRLALAVGALFLVVTGGAAWRELANRQAVAVAEAGRRAQQGTRLQYEAIAAWKKGDPGLAWLLAADALEALESPEARGVVLGATSRVIIPLVERHSAGRACHFVGWNADGVVAVTGTGEVSVRRDGQWRTLDPGTAGPGQSAQVIRNAAWGAGDALWIGDGPRPPGWLDTRSGTFQPLSAMVEFRSLAPLPGGGALAGGMEGDIVEIGVGGEARRLPISLEGPIVAIAAEAGLIAAADSTGAVAVFPADDPDAAWRLPEVDGTYALAFGPGAGWLAVSDLGRSPRENTTLWDTRTHQPISSLSNQDTATNAIAVSPDGRWIAAACSGDGACLWSTSGQQLQHLSLSGEQVGDVTFSPDGRRLSVVTTACTYLEWSLPDARTWDVLPTSSPTLSVDPAARFALNASMTEVLRWDLLLPEPLARWAAPAPDLAQIAAGPSSVAYADHHGDLWWLDAITGRVSTLPGAGGPVWAMTMAPDERHLAVATSGAVRVYDRGGAVAAETHFDAPYPRLTWSSDGEWIAVNAADQLIRIHAQDWSVDPPRPHTHPNYATPVIAPGGQEILWLADEPKVWVEDLQGEGHALATEGAVTQGVWLGATHRVAVVGSQGEVEILDTTTGRGLARIPAMWGSWGPLAATPDGRWLMAGSRTGERGPYDLSALDWTADEALRRAVLAAGERPR